MYTTAGLLDVHERTHRTFVQLLDHLETIPAEDLTRPVEGFSYATLASQLHHLIGGEWYWMGVMQGDPRYDDDADEHETLEALRALHAKVRADTAAYLSGLSDEDASTPQTVTKWNGDTAEITPAHALLRTQTHIFQHRGEVASMLRLLGHSHPSMLDFPVV